MAAELIRMENISKFYGRVQALDRVTFKVYQGEIVGLLGDNGAGKSTLIKVLSGAVPVTSGTITIKGRKVSIRNTNDAIANGIETIYQDSALVPQLSIARNLFLGREPVRGGGVLGRLDEEIARCGTMHAGQRLDQRRLAGAVVAEEAQDFARVHLQRDVVQDVDRAEGLVDVAEFDDRGRHHFVPFFGL